MMSRLVLFCAALLCLSGALPAAAQMDTVERQAQVPFREDSGLITAEYYLATGKYAEALSVLSGVLKRQPASADAYTYRGFAYHRLGDRRKARADYDRALGINPRHLGANKYLAELHLDEDRMAEAIEQMHALRLICQGMPCDELNELESDINRYKRGSHPPKN